MGQVQLQPDQENQYIKIWRQQKCLCLRLVYPNIYITSTTTEETFRSTK